MKLEKTSEPSPKKLVYSVSFKNSATDVGVNAGELSGSKLMKKMTSVMPGSSAPLVGLPSDDAKLQNGSDRAQRGPDQLDQQNHEIREESDNNSSIPSCMGDLDKQADEREQPRAKKLNIKVSVDSLKRKGEKSRASAARLKRSGS